MSSWLSDHLDSMQEQQNKWAESEEAQVVRKEFRRLAKRPPS
jgi:hypothetical protein